MIGKSEKAMAIWGIVPLLFLAGGVVYGVEDDGQMQALKEGMAVRNAAIELYQRVFSVPCIDDLALVLSEGGTNVSVAVKTATHGLFANVCRVAVDVYVAADEVRKTFVLRFPVDGAGSRQCVYDESGSVVWGLEFESGRPTEGEKGCLIRAFEFSRSGDVIRTWSRSAKDRILVRDGCRGRLVCEVKYDQVHRFFMDLQNARTGRSLDEDSVESRIDKWLSSSIQGVSLTNGNALVVKTRTWGGEEWVRIGGVGSYRQVPEGSVFVVGRGDSFFFRRGEPCSELRLLGDGDIERLRLDLTLDFAGETNLVYFLGGGFQAVISPLRQKVFIPRERIVRDFPFPFQGTWSSEKECRQWFEGRGFGSRKRITMKLARANRRVAKALYHYAVHGPGCESVESAIRANGWTNVPMAVDGVLGLDRSERIRKMDVLIGGRGNDRFVRVIRFGVESDDGQACFFRFDSVGRPRWCFRMKRVEGATDTRWKLDNRFAFEFGEDGRVCRALVLGANPLLVANGIDQCFVGEPEQIRQFVSDLCQAVKGSTLD